ncbi:hypothetical protein DFP72DRAFT_1050884 [Ephemerocybe angulata]|uniref:Uncharacterized protein n=1 Tax=Ephemerocybe angulata TaxID=980116 RepID=A0A8H6LZG5_9AGAR|nr:hypothetical protein DFP72DRAFT_1050884 [Tulosesus angulatus]
MKVNCVLFASLLIGVCDLLTGVRAYSDYNSELDARDNIDYLSTRDFAYDYQDLDAREPATIEVPFDPSLRDFLEKAAVMYRRGGSLSVCRGELIGKVSLFIGHPATPNSNTYYESEELEVYQRDKGSYIKKRIAKLVKEKHFKKISPVFTLRVGKKNGKATEATILGDDDKLTTVAPGLNCNSYTAYKLWAGKAPEGPAS